MGRKESYQTNKNNPTNHSKIKFTFSGVIFSLQAILNKTSSIMRAAWGAPNPRNEVLELVLVLHIRPVNRKFGIL